MSAKELEKLCEEYNREAWRHLRWLNLPMATHYSLLKTKTYLEWIKKLKEEKNEKLGHTKDEEAS